MKSKSFVRGSAALLATLTLMSGKLSAMQPTMSQPVMMQPMMYPVQQLSVKEQMMLQNNAADNQIALQNNGADNAIKVQDNYFKNMKDYRDSDPFTKWTLRVLGALGLTTVADVGAGWCATGNPWWFLDGTEGDMENINAAKARNHEQMYGVASKAASVIGCVWAGILYGLQIVANATNKKGVVFVNI